MINCNCNCNNSCNNVSGDHINVFANVNGIPYIVSEYMDRSNLMQVDRSAIISEINIDTRRAMQPIVDISIDDIGKRNTDGLPNIVGNNTMQQNLLKAIGIYGPMQNYQLGVLRRGIVLRVTYQIEEFKSGSVLRTMREDIRIKDRNYFVDVNPREINDNAFIVNFSDVVPSTITEFTRGNEPMYFRITSIEMFYECVIPTAARNRLKQSVCGCYDNLDGIYDGSDPDFYRYHMQMQHQHLLGYDHLNCNRYGNEDISAYLPNTWSSFNQFYHFNNSGRDVLLHGDEINNPNVEVRCIPCGRVNVNRKFVINPAAMIIFKLSVWKNDVVLVNDTTMIARALKANLIDDCFTNCECNHDHEHCQCGNPGNENIINPDYETVIRLLNDNQRINRHQECVITSLTNTVASLSDSIKIIQDTLAKITGETPSEPENPDDSSDVTEPGNSEETPSDTPSDTPGTGDVTNNNVDSGEDNTLPEVDHSGDVTEEVPSQDDTASVGE